MSPSSVMADNFGKNLPHVGPISPSSKLIEFREFDVGWETFEHDDHRIPASMMEPVQRLTGARIPLKGYLGAVQDLCHKHNILLVCEESKAGSSRTGFDIAFQAEDVKPDLVTLGKAVTGGMYPVSVLMGKAHVMDVISKCEITGTYSASSAGCGLCRCASLVGCFEGGKDIGALPTAGRHCPKSRRASARRGVVIGTGANRFRFSAPLTIQGDDLVKGIQIMYCLKYKG